MCVFFQVLQGYNSHVFLIKNMESNTVNDWPLYCRSRDVKQLLVYVMTCLFVQYKCESALNDSDLAL